MTTIMIRQFIRRRNMSVRSLQGRRTTVQPVHAMNAEQRQTAAYLWTKPTDLSNWPAFRQL